MILKTKQQRTFTILISLLILLTACVPSVGVGPAAQTNSAVSALAVQKVERNQLAPSIQIGNQSGVAGYSVAVFGSDFGNTAGTVTVLGQSASIVTWEARFVQITVPNVPDGSGELVLTTADMQSASLPFTVYTINPLFQQTTDRFKNIAFNKRANLFGLEDELCFAQPTNESLPAEVFLTNYRCGFDGVNNVGDATFGADSSLGTEGIIALNLEADLTGELWFQFFLNSSWYPDDPPFVPANYKIEVSNNSTDGQDGSWLTLQTIDNNNRATRMHRVTVPSGNYTWIRMFVTDGGTNDSAAAGNDFRLREIRIYQPVAGTAKPDSFALYGDSLTAGAFDAINQSGFAEAVKNKRMSENDQPFTVFGLSGQNSSGLINGSSDVDIYDALSLDGMQTNTRFWGIGIGTNDSEDGAIGLTQNGSNVSQYDERLSAVVIDLINSGRVPMIARIPDTDESRGGAGELVTKKKILEDIDRIAAEYLLIPGPDFYTSFRRNIEVESGSWFSDDGTHHTPAGEAQLIDLWATAFVTGQLAQQPPLPTPSSTLVTNPTAAATQPAMATQVATPTATPVNPSQLKLTFLPIVIWNIGQAND